MYTHLLTPHAPLVLRTGKPFGETGGSDTFSFPLPSTVAGALRAACADENKLDFTSEKENIRNWECHAALPVAIGSAGNAEPMFPRPADIRYIQAGEKLILQQLAPAAMEKGEGCDLPNGLLPVFLSGDDKSKPTQGPAWWREKPTYEWLLGELPESKGLGPDPLPIDTRSHVRLDPRSLAATTGMLFQSSGPDFSSQRRSSQEEIGERGWKSEHYGLLAKFAKPIQPTLVRLGGESRLTAVARCDTWPEIPKTLNDRLLATRYIRLVLATPALFSDGWKPGWVGENLIGVPPCLPGFTLRLCAAAIDRWQAISGWDLAANKPKATRRTVPAGSIYWFEIMEPVAGWPEKMWLAPVSDGEQDRRDGFGMVLPGIWNY